jgi:hypothetical protein
MSRFKAAAVCPGIAGALATSVIREAMPITNATEISFIIYILSRVDLVPAIDGAAITLPRVRSPILH